MTRAVLLRGDPQEARQPIAAVLSAEDNLNATLDRLANTAKIDVASFMRGRTLVEAAAALEDAAIDSDGLFAFAGFAAALQDVSAHGIMPLVEERLQAGSLSGMERKLRRSPSGSWQRRSTRSWATN